MWSTSRSSSSQPMKIVVKMCVVVNIRSVSSPGRLDEHVTPSFKRIGSGTEHRVASLTGRWRWVARCFRPAVDKQPTVAEFGRCRVDGVVGQSTNLFACRRFVVCVRRQVIFTWRRVVSIAGNSRQQVSRLCLLC